VLETIQVNTPDHSVMVDVTDLVGRKVQESGIRNGLCVISVPHTTAGITINEGADPAVLEDILSTLEAMVPRKGPYRHMEGNSAAHIKASLMGSSVQLIIEDGRLVLGTWQRIFLCEFDGPRTRKVRMKIMDG
jgi:secondary thiamine-phosphate synthase enzyme